MVILASNNCLFVTLASRQTLQAFDCISTCIPSLFNGQILKHFSHSVLSVIKLKNN